MVLVNESTLVPNDTYPRFFWCVPTTSTNQRSFSHTHVGVSVWMVLVNKSTVVPIDTYAGFFSSLPTTSTIQRSFSHTHMEASTHHPPRQQINANFDTHVLGYRSEWCLSTNQRWSRTTPIQDFFAVYPPR